MAVAVIGQLEVGMVSTRAQLVAERTVLLWLNLINQIRDQDAKNAVWPMYPLPERPNGIR